MEVHVSLVGREGLSGEIYRQLRRAIVEGRLNPCQALPATRESRRLSVVRNTVVVAYDRLAGEGLVESRAGSGTYVSAEVSAWRRDVGAGAGSRASRAAPRPRPLWDKVPVPSSFERKAAFDFRAGTPDSSKFPHGTWRRLTGRVLRADSDVPVVYGHPGGHPALRAAIARHIGIARGVVTAEDDVTVTNGIQQALDVVARAVVGPGDTVAVEEPCYPPPRFLFETLGLRVVGVPVDREGLVVDALPRRARLVYTTPSHQFPLGVTMSLPRRLALLAWVERHGAVVIEDDYDSELRFHGRPLEPLHVLDSLGRVIYVGSFSKTLLPTLRLGFVATPPSLTAAVHRAKYVADWHTAHLSQAVLGFARHIRKMQAP